MRQWELYGITDAAEVEADLAATTHDRFPIVLWATDRFLQFTSSPKGIVQHLELAVDPEASGLLDLFKPGELGIDVIDAHLGALGGWPTRCEVRGRDRTFHCQVVPLRDAAGETTGTRCVALSEVVELAEPT